MGTMKIEVTFTPAEFAGLRRRDLSNVVCVVFDVLRATSTMVTALACGAESILPVASIEDAVQCRKQDPEVLLGGERDGIRITAAVSGGLDFDLGNSPREYTDATVRGRRIVTTTTNGTRAFAACRGAKQVLAGAFLNLGSTARHLARLQSRRVVLVCAGTGETAAFEDCLGAGALCRLMSAYAGSVELEDSASFSADMYAAYANDLRVAMWKSTNACRLMAIPELRDDVRFCLVEDQFTIVAGADGEGPLRVVSGV
jgi:2-phosphosulfolactate phosphatase